MYCPGLLEYIRLVWPPTRDVGRCPQATWYVQICAQNGVKPKVGAILKKIDVWSDTDAILPGESIDKAIVSLQIPEVLNDEAIQVILWKKFESAKRLYRFKPPNF